MKKKSGLKGLVSLDEVMAALPSRSGNLVEARGRRNSCESS